MKGRSFIYVYRPGVGNKTLRSILFQTESKANYFGIIHVNVRLLSVPVCPHESLSVKEKRRGIQSLLLPKKRRGIQSLLLPNHEEDWGCRQCTERTYILFQNGCHFRVLCFLGNQPLLPCFKFKNEATRGNLKENKRTL